MVIAIYLRTKVKFTKIDFFVVKGNFLFVNYDFIKITFNLLYLNYLRCKKIKSLDNNCEYCLIAGSHSIIRMSCAFIQLICTDNSRGKLFLFIFSFFTSYLKFCSMTGEWGV